MYFSGRFPFVRDRNMKSLVLSALEGQYEMMINSYEILIKPVRKSVCQDHQGSM